MSGLGGWVGVGVMDRCYRLIESGREAIDVMALRRVEMEDG